MLLSIILLFLVPSVVEGCGGFMCQPQQPVLQSGENIVFGVRPSSSSGGGGVEIDMAIQINYEGPAENFAWVIPVPTQPCLSTTSDLLFDELFDSIRPEFRFTINHDLSTTCSEEQLEDEECIFGTIAGSDSSGGSAVVLEEGSVGPFDFVILEAAEGRPETVFDWLETNGFDHPDDAANLITYYAEMDMKLVALRLKKDTNTGMIRPIVLSYDLPTTVDLGSNPVACIPIELTRIAAVENMPIQVYLLGPSRGVAYNFAEMKIDMTLEDYLDCQNSFGGPPSQNCYLNSFRTLVGAAARDINGHAFVTEYADDIASSNLKGTIALDVNLESLMRETTPIEFLTRLLSIGVPGSTLVQNIISKYIPNDYTDGWCESIMTNVYLPNNPGRMANCLEYLVSTNEDYVFDWLGLALELDSEIFQPAQQAEDWVLSYQYITRMYAQLDPDQMDKDLLFAFLPDLPDISRIINVVAEPICNGTEGTIGLDVRRAAESSDIPSTRIDARLEECGGWRTIQPTFVDDGTASPALSIISYDFLDGPTANSESPASAARVLFRDPTTGLFAPEKIADMITILDDKSIPMMASSSSTTPLGPSGRRCVFPSIDGESSGGARSYFSSSGWLVDIRVMFVMLAASAAMRVL